MSFVGCTEQYQFCHSARCSPLTGLYASDKTKNAIAQTDAQSALSNLLWKAIWGTNMSYLIIFLGADVLRANEKLYRLGFLSSAPENSQWQLEMENMHNVSLAFLQRRFVDFADHPSLEIRPNATVRDYLDPPGEQERFCDAMKIRSSGHTSFNVVALLALCLTCIFIILLSLLLPMLVGLRWPLRLPARTAAGRSRSPRTALWEEQDILRLLEDAWELRNMRRLDPVGRVNEDRIPLENVGREQTVQPRALNSGEGRLEGQLSRTRQAT